MVCWRQDGGPRTVLITIFSIRSRSLPWFFRKPGHGHAIAPNGADSLVQGRNCVFARNENVVSCNRGRVELKRDRTAWPGGARRTGAPGEKQSGPRVSRAGAEAESHGNREGGSGGSAEWDGEGGEDSGRAPGAGDGCIGSS